MQCLGQLLRRYVCIGCGRMDGHAEGLTHPAKVVRRRVVPGKEPLASMPRGLSNKDWAVNRIGLIGLTEVAYKQAGAFARGSPVGFWAVPDLTAWGSIQVDERGYLSWLGRGKKTLC